MLRSPLPCLTAAFLVAGCVANTDRSGTVLPACSAPVVDTTGWQRIPGPLRGYSFLLPPSFAEDTLALFHHGGIEWEDGARVIYLMNGYGPARKGRVDHVETPEHSECWDRIADLPVWISVGRTDSLYHVSSWFQTPLPPGQEFGELDVALGGWSPKAADQATLLAILRSIRPEQP